MRNRTLATLNPAYSHLASEIDRLAESGLPADARTVYEGRNRVVRFSRGGLELSVKAFKVPGLIRGLVYGCLRPSKARRSYENAVRLLEAGFATPEPIAWVETRSFGGRLRNSYYVCVHLTDAPHVGVLEPDLQMRDLIIPLMARELASLHKAGIFMKDFTPGNALVTDRKEPAKMRLNYVDLNRMKFGVSNRRLLRRNFNAPLYSDVDLALLLEEYARITGMAEATVKREALMARRRYNLLKRLAHPMRYLRRPPR